MVRRLFGSLMFLGVSVILFQIAGRLAWDQRAGWGWFAFLGLMLSGVALNLWNGEIPTNQCPRCQKPYSPHDLE